MCCVGGNKNYTHGRECLWVSELGEHQELLLVCITVCLKHWADLQIFTSCFYAQFKDAKETANKYVM